jgi:parvulin-like peptidyl-prolyl isomerase
MAIRMWTLRALILVLVLGGVTQAKPGKPKTAATVNGDPITVDDVEAILKARPIEGMRLTPADLNAMRQDALNMLVDELIMHQFLVKNAPSVPTSQVNKKMAELQDALRAQGQNIDDYYKANGQTEIQVRNSIVSSLQWAAYLDKQLTEPVLRKYYEDNRDQFDDVSVRVSHILLRLKPGTNASDREVVQNWLLGIRQQIVAGKLDFADAAKQFSQDITSAKGGDLGFITRKGQVEEAFAKAAFALKLNGVSDVVQTESGLHLIKVTERKAANPSEFKLVEDKIRVLVSEELMNALLIQQRKIADVKIFQTAEQPPKVQSGK